jgi:hypothetical protein
MLTRYNNFHLTIDRSKPKSAHDLCFRVPNSVNFDRWHSRKRLQMSILKTYYNLLNLPLHIVEIPICKAI